MSLRQVLREWLDHRKDVLVRRSNFRLAEIARRLEILDGYLDRLSQPRRGDPHHPRGGRAEARADGALQAHRQAGRSHPQHAAARACASSRKWKSAASTQKLTKEQKGLKALLKSDDEQWAKISDEIKAVKEKFSKKTPLGRRRTDFCRSPRDRRRSRTVDDREGAGHRRLLREGLDPHHEGPPRGCLGLTYKDGDKGQFAFHAMTTDKIMLFSSSGKFFTLDVAKLPGGRGHGEPVRLMCDLDAADSIVSLFVHVPGTKRLLASTEGDGFIVPEEECVANTRKGKQVLNVKAPGRGAASACAVPEDATHVATIGENRKMIIFKLAEVPEMARGKGVRLQKFKDGGLSDARAFKLKEGLSAGSTARAATSSSPISRNGSANAPRPAACRPRVSRSATSSGEPDLDAAGRSSSHGHSPACCC